MGNLIGEVIPDWEKEMAVMHLATDTVWIIKHILPKAGIIVIMDPKTKKRVRVDEVSFDWEYDIL